MEKWDKLSMKDRAKYIQLAVSSGVTDLNNIRDTYNSFAEGGDTQTSNTVSNTPKQVVNTKEYTPSTLAGWVTQLFTGDNNKAAYADISSSTFDAGADAIPVVGNVAGMAVSIGDSLYDAGKLIADPSWENTSDLGLSLLGIIPGAGIVKDSKNLAKGSKLLYDAAKKSAKNAPKKLKQTYKNIRTTKPKKSTYSNTISNKPIPLKPKPVKWNWNIDKKNIKDTMEVLSYYRYLDTENDIFNPISYLNSE